MGDKVVGRGKVVLEVDDRSLRKGMDGGEARFKKGLRSMEQDFGRHTTQQTKTSGVLGTGISKGLLVGTAAAVAGLALLTKGAKSAWDEMSAGAKTGAQTVAVIKSTGDVSNVTAKQVDALAVAQMKKSGVDDEVIKSGENMLLTFTNIRNEAGRGNDIFTQSNAVLQDMSVALGTDVPKSAIQLGKALNDPIKGVSALQRVGVTFNEGQKKQIKTMVEAGNTMGAQKLILRELNKEFGGSAAALGKTLPGQLSILRESLKNTAGQLLGTFMPGLLKLTQFATAHVVPALQDVADFVSKVFAQKTFSGKVHVAAEGLKDLGVRVRDTLENAVRKIDWQALGATLSTDLGKGLKFSGDLLGGLVESLSKNKDKIATVVDELVQMLGTSLNAHTGMLGKIGATAIAATFVTLTDPAFWAEHWKLGLIIAGTVLPVARLAQLGEKLGMLILRPLVKLFGPELGRIASAGVDWLLRGLEHLGPRLAENVTVMLVGIEKNFGRWAGRAGELISSGLSKAFEFLTTRVPRILRLAFKLDVVAGFVNGATDLLSRFWIWLKTTGLKAASVMLEPFSHMPGHLGKWAREAKDAVNEQLAEINANQATRRIDKLRKELAGLKADSAPAIGVKVKLLLTYGSSGQPTRKGDGLVSSIQKDAQRYANANPIEAQSLGGTGFAGTIGNAANPGGLSTWILDDLALGQRMGLHLNSGYRPGAVTSSGNRSLHAIGQAIDMGGTGSQMSAYARAEAGRSGVAEVIYTPVGWWHPGAGWGPVTDRRIAANHYSHVHVGVKGGDGLVGVGQATGPYGDGLASLGLGPQAYPGEGPITGKKKRRKITRPPLRKLPAGRKIRAKFSPKKTGEAAVDAMILSLGSLEQGRTNAETNYGIRVRELGADDTELVKQRAAVDPVTGETYQEDYLDTAEVAREVADVDELLGLQHDIEKRTQAIQALIPKIIGAIRTALVKVKAGIRDALGLGRSATLQAREAGRRKEPKEEARYNALASSYAATAADLESRRSTLAGELPGYVQQIQDEGFALRNTALDVGDLDKRRADLLGTPSPASTAPGGGGGGGGGGGDFQDPSTIGTAEWGPGGDPGQNMPPAPDVNAMIAEVLASRSGWISTFGGDVFSRGAGGLRLGSSPLGPIAAAPPAVTKTVTVNQHFHKPSDDQHVPLHHARFAAENALG